MADTENDNVLTIDGMSKSFGRNRSGSHFNERTPWNRYGSYGRTAQAPTMIKCLFGTSGSGARNEPRLAVPSCR